MALHAHLLLVCSMVNSVMMSSAPLRIVPLGDSITEGMCGEFHSYRPFLWHSLVLQRQRAQGGRAPQLRGGISAPRTNVVRDYSGVEFVGSRFGEWKPGNGTLAQGPCATGGPAARQ